ncbi:MAG: DUF3300 domain-containing protein [Bryobacteraceae bacterium]
MTTNRRNSRRAIGAVCVMLLAPAAGVLRAQEPEPYDQGPPAGQLLAPQQLDAMVAPIALYPDALLSQVLVAATYPAEVTDAAAWLDQNRYLQGQQLAEAAQQQNWDASIQALVAFPDVLSRLASNMQWTTDLGNAFLAQQADVMNAVQRMRMQAMRAGRLQSNDQEVVRTQTDEGRTVVVIEPANPEVVYVPAYNPEYIWGPPVYGYYYPDLYYPAIGFGFGFGHGIYIGGFWGGLGWGGWGWRPNWFRCSVYENRYFFDHYHYRGYGGGFGANRIWAHDPVHRAGVPYSNRALMGRYDSISRAHAVNRGGAYGGQRYGNQSWNANRGGNYSRPGGSGYQAGQSSGWSRFGQPGVNRSTPSYGGRTYGAQPSTGRATPNYGGNSGYRTAPNYGSSRSYGASPYRTTPSYGSSPSPSYRQSYPAAPSYSGNSSYRSAPSYGGGSYRSSPSYGGNSSYRAAPSYGGGNYRSSPSYGGNSSYRAAPSYGGGNYRSSPSYGGGRAYRSAPSYGGNYRSAPSNGGGGSYRSAPSSGGGSYRSSGGGGGSRGGSSSHGGRR